MGTWFWDLEFKKKLGRSILEFSWVNHSVPREVEKNSNLNKFYRRLNQLGKYLQLVLVFSQLETVTDDAFSHTALLEWAVSNSIGFRRCYQSTEFAYFDKGKRKKTHIQNFPSKTRSLSISCRLCFESFPISITSVWDIV